MSQKYEILHEVGWDSLSQSHSYERLTTVKNEQAAIDFVSNVNNIGKYGDMIIRMKSNGNIWTYNERNKSWDKE